MRISLLKKTLLPILVGGLLFAGCSSDDTSTREEALPQGISFSVSTHSPTLRNAEVSQNILLSSMEEDTLLVLSRTERPIASDETSSLRGAVVTSTTLQDFGFSAGGNQNLIPDYVYNVETTSKGILKTTTYWPENIETLYYYAVMPFATENNNIILSGQSETPSISFEVKAENSEQVDLLVAVGSHTNTTKDGKTEVIPLTFQHKLTAVDFVVGSELSSLGKTISTIQIVNAQKKGVYDINAGTWTPEEGSASSFSWTIPSSITSQESGTKLTEGVDGTFWMIPQSFASTDGAYLRVAFTDGSALRYSLAGEEWIAGAQVEYSILNTASEEWVLEVDNSSTNTAISETDIIDFPFIWNTTSSTVTPSTLNLTLKSYVKSATGVITATPWQVVGYSTDGGNTFSTSLPSNWAISTTSGSGGQATTLTVTNTPVAVNLLEARNNELKNATAVGTESAPYDLSLFDSQGNATARNTANCYLVSAPGWYKIPLVYGNGIKNGVVNTNAFRPTMPTGSSLFSNNFYTPFKNHDNSAITTPYINQQASSIYPVTTGVVSWSDISNPISNITVDRSSSSASEHFLKFYVAPTLIANGNALISVRSAAGTVNWSYHLWFAPKSSLATHKAVNHENETYEFASEAIGTRYTYWMGTQNRNSEELVVKLQQTSGQKKTTTLTFRQLPGAYREMYAMLYQWGSKNPLPGTSATFSTSAYSASNKGTVNEWDFIRSPSVMWYYNSNNSQYNRWYNIRNSDYAKVNMWSALNTSTTPTNNNVVKTIFDPSPVGFKVPPGRAFSGISVTGENVANVTSSDVNGSVLWDNGAYFNFDKEDASRWVFIPALGYRAAESAQLQSGFIMLWTASANTNGQAYAFEVEEGAVEVSANNWQATGLIDILNVAGLYKERHAAAVLPIKE